MEDFRCWGLVDRYNAIFPIPVCFCLFSVSGKRIDAVKIFRRNFFLVSSCWDGFKDVGACWSTRTARSEVKSWFFGLFSRPLPNGIQWLAFRFFRCWHNDYISMLRWTQLCGTFDSGLSRRSALTSWPFWRCILRNCKGPSKLGLLYYVYSRVKWTKMVRIGRIHAYMAPCTSSNQKGKYEFSLWSSEGNAVCCSFVEF